jgi:hypothetical protein
MEWKDVPIFISSTFNDMHAERDYLVKNVFPELAEWCEKRKLRLIDIDLRWGVTSADSKANNVVKVCLERIDDCRPFFLCFLGQRRGWVPNDPLRYCSDESLEQYTKNGNPMDYKKDGLHRNDEIGNDSFNEYQGLEKYEGKNAVTEMEIEHALLSPMYKIINRQKHEKNPEPTEHALFFVRENIFKSNDLSSNQRKIYLNDEVLKYGGDTQKVEDKLEEFKQKIIDSYKEKVTYYTCQWGKSIETPELLAEENGEDISKGRLIEFKANDEELKTVIINALKDAIIKKYPDREKVKQYDEAEKSSYEYAYNTDLEQQQLFIRLNAEGYIPRADITDKLNKYVDDSSNDNYFLLTAKAGLGKTMLLTNYATELTKGHKVYARFCGTSDLSSEQYSLWKSIFYQANVIIPDTLDELRNNISELLKKMAQKGKTIIVIDAINQIYGGLDMLLWLPKTLPDGIKMIISLKEDEKSMPILQNIELSADNHFPIPLFKEKKKLIENFLERYFKALDEEDKDTICNLPYSNNPLFLKILLHNLRMFGAFKQLKPEIKKYGDTPEKAFKAVLIRLEDDPAYDIINPKESVPYLFGLLSFARKGLSELELLICFKNKYPNEIETKILGTIRFYLRQVRPFMARREGRADFLYESFMLAAQAKYKKDAITLQQALSDCFLKFCDPVGDGSFDSDSNRALTEYAYHLMKSDTEKGAKLYTNIPYLTARCSHSPISGLLEEYNQLSISAKEQVHEYEKVIFRYMQILSEYKYALPSLLYLSDTNDIKTKLLQVQEKGKIKSTWLKADLLSPITSVQEESEDNSFSCKILTENELGTTSAVAIAQNADWAFYTTARGKIGVTNTQSMEPYNTVISVAPKDISSLTVSENGNYLVVGFEDETAELVKVMLNNVGLTARTIGSFPYRLPYGNSGIFAFESDNALWYQGTDGYLNRMILSENELIPEKNLFIDEDVTSLCVGTESICYSVWKKTTTTLFLLSLTGNRLLSSKEFTDNDIVIMGVSGSNFVAASMQQKPDYEIYILDSDLNIVFKESLSFPVAAFCEYDSKLVIMPRSNNSSMLFLWDYAAKTLLSVKHIFKYLSQLFVKTNNDGTFTLISNLLLTQFDIQSGQKTLSEKIIGITELNHDRIIVSINDKKEILLHNEKETVVLPNNMSPMLSMLFTDKHGLLFDNNGDGYIFQLNNIRLNGRYPDGLYFTTAAVGRDDLVYFYDKRGQLRTPSNVLENLSSYRLDYVHLYVFDNYLVVTGTTPNKMTINDYDAPIIAVFYEILPNNTLRKIGERYFPILQGLIKDICYDSQTKNIYVFFTSGKFAKYESVIYGQIQNIIEESEIFSSLHCPNSKNHFSAIVIENNLCVLSDGIITIYDAVSLKYKSELSAEEPFSQMVKDINSGKLFAIIGDNAVAEISIIN